jgi:chromosome segregation ATPase
MDEQKLKLQINSEEYNRSHKLTTQLQNLEAEYYVLEVDERGFNTDLEAINYSNQALMDRNADLKVEYEALQKHSTLLTQQNKDLQRELDSFVETDDIVRRNLDRKEKVNAIRTSVNTALNQSNIMVQQARTPTKIQYDEQVFQPDRVQTFHGNAGQRASYSGAQDRYNTRGTLLDRSNVIYDQR